MLKKLNIEDYADKIFKSNSHGELSHLEDYIIIAEYFNEETVKQFRNWFVKVVEEAEQKWKRPESIYQHILKIIIDSVD